MKKLILTGSLLCVVSGSFAGASIPAKATPKLAVPTPSPVPVKTNAAPVKNVSTVAPAKGLLGDSKASGMPAMPPAAHVQLELVKISQAFLAEFNQAEISQLGQVFESTLNTALASKDFDQAFVKLLTAVQEIASSIGSKLSVCKEIQVKLNTAVANASVSFNKLVSSGVVPSQTNEFYFIKIANAVLAGLKDGLNKVKPSKEVCATPVEPKAPLADKTSPKASVAPDQSKMPVAVPANSKTPVAPAPVPAPVK